MSDFLDHDPSAPEQVPEAAPAPVGPTPEAIIERAAAAYLAGNNGRSRATFDQQLANGKESIKYLVSVARVELTGLAAKPDNSATLAEQIRGIAKGGTLRRDGTVSNRGRTV